MAPNLPDHRAPAERIAEYFSGEEGRRRYERLLLTTERRIRSMHWCISTDDGSMPGGQQALDVVHGALKFLLSTAPAPKGGHNYLPADVSVAAAIRFVIKRRVNHAAEAPENTNRDDHLTVDREGEPVDLLDSDALYWDPATTELSPQQLATMAARSERFIEFTHKDRDVCNMLILIRDRGIAGPAEKIAKELGIRLGEVYLARKRLGTLVKKFGKSA